MGIYKHMLSAHNDFCGCDYCQILVKYVNKKIDLQRMKRALLEAEYRFDDRAVLFYEMIIIPKQQNLIKDLKKHKDGLKKINL